MKKALSILRNIQSLKKCFIINKQNLFRTQHHNLAFGVNVLITDSRLDLREGTASVFM